MLRIRELLILVSLLALFGCNPTEQAEQAQNPIIAEALNKTWKDWEKDPAAAKRFCFYFQQELTPAQQTPEGLKAAMLACQVTAQQDAQQEFGKW
jgi:hypothetical protein